MKSRVASVLLASLLLLGGTGCAYRYQFDTGLPPSGERVQEWRSIWLWGWVNASSFDLEKACPSGVSRFGSYVNFLNWLPSFLTVGIYTPRTVFAECASAPVAGAAAGAASGAEEVSR